MKKTIVAIEIATTSPSAKILLEDKIKRILQACSDGVHAKNGVVFADNFDTKKFIKNNP